MNNLVFAQQSLKGRFGFGFGYQSGIETYNFNVLNKTFLNQNEKGLNDNLLLNGISGYLYFLIFPDTRISFNILNSEKNIQSSANRYFNFEQNLWNAGFEYTFTLWRFNISSGIFFGKISDMIELTYFDGNSNLSQIVNQFNSQNYSNSSISFENVSYHLYPSLNFEYSLTRFLAARISYAYVFRLNQDWKFMRKFEVKNLPKDLVRNNQIIQLGLLIGFMSK